MTGRAMSREASASEQRRRCISIGVSQYRKKA
jgi:hypothetical protein